MREAPESAEYDRAVFATFQEQVDAGRGTGAGCAGRSSRSRPSSPPTTYRRSCSPKPPEHYPAALAQVAASPGEAREGDRRPQSLLARRFRSRHAHVFRSSAGAGGDTGRARQTKRRNGRKARSLPPGAAFPEPEFDTWPVCERLVSHVRAVASQVTADSRALAWLLTAAGTYLQERAALADVLPLYERGLAIAERLAKADPGNAGWQRDLSVSHDKIGDVLRAQGNLAGRARQLPGLARHRRAARQSRSRQCRLAARPLRLAQQDRRRAAWPRATSPAALDSYKASLAISRPARQSRSRQCRLAARPLRLARQDRRRASGAGQPRRRRSTATRPRSPSASASPKPIPAMPAGSATSPSRTTRSATCCVAQGNLAGGARQLPGLARHRRASRQGRSRQCRLAARPLRLARQDRRRAPGAGQPRRRRWTATRPRSPSASVWPKPIPAMPAGSATSPSRTTGSATCSGRRATSPAALDSYKACARHRRPSRQGRSRKCRLAARPLRLAQQDRRRAAWLRATSPAALDSYKAALAIRDRLAKADPGNAGWQRDLSVSHDKIGDVLRRAGQPRRRRSTATRPRSPSPSVSPKPIPAMPAGSATWR